MRRKPLAAVLVLLSAALVLGGNALLDAGWGSALRSIADRVLPNPEITMWAPAPEPGSHASSYADATGAGANYVYLVDAADDLKKDTESGNYNPLLYRYHTENGVLGDADRLALAETLDASIERMASAYALYDYGVWTPILDSIFYESLYGIGKAVLGGTYRRRTRTRYGERKKKSNEEAL